MEFKQEEKVVDVVIPLLKATKDKNNSVTYDGLFGTAFLIGNQGFAITCAHVIEQILDDFKGQIIVTHFIYNGQLFPFEVIKYEKHPTEDVAIIKIDNNNLKSWLQVQNATEYSSCEYQGWGYPRETANELKKLQPDAKEFPELIYTQGYIRRNINRELYPTLIYRGKAFYELSDLGGGGYSGSPIIKKNRTSEKWNVIGIYVGEKFSEECQVGYAVNSKSFYNWTPEILGCSVFEESLK